MFFIVGGYLIEASGLNTSFTLNSSKNFVGIVVNLSDIEQNNNINTVGISSYVTVGFIDNFTIEKTGDNFTILSRLGKGWDNYHYNTVKFRSLTVNDNIINGDLLVIPVAVFYDNAVYSVLGFHSKASLEEFLTESAIDELENKLNNKFVWRSGGETKGDIGRLNITKHTIKSLDNEPLTNDDNLLRIDTRKLRIPNLYYQQDNTNHLLSNMKWDDDDHYIPLKINKNGYVLAGTTPIYAGGTGADNKVDAKTNLGIKWGTAAPSGGAVGDIYFKIIE